ncbi:hypothetical protein TI10_08875 [Photorhabdus luminescens subsp. luminescens]|uniref:TIGR02646 family protein n=1 Tax=Photorhabdus luminescens TaxID=29488 RepID=A0A1G5R6U1_PHOLU|nr:retron Ec78 anti-phage system effector HNH endonuclease PtuB [Photorhabdus luminescens]KMW73209.1 hypothetical protein TI10_08875 [Photorhabdus luminescens subsp. luminescens]SCZ69747.1 TIGR02646 family protein [Photorhabdus luminescens]
MKALTRPPKPHVLNQFKAGQNTWMEIDQTEIWPHLEEMQGAFCAYCECRLNRKHIEHFRPRGKFSALTFDWENLFGSCGDSSKSGGWERCGIYKDHGAGAYDVNQLIKPDVENPDDFLLFLTTGRVIPASGLQGQALKKAEETIRVFNLNGDAKLFGRRRTALQNVIKEVEYFYLTFEELEEEEWTLLLHEQLEELKTEEFSTALRHAWLYNKQFI